MGRGILFIWDHGEIVEWLRYEMDGLNHLRIDEVYDADSNGELEDPSASGDAWRVQRVYINGKISPSSK